ncbi:MAG: IS3 family transposase, partial [Anaerolineae bacterium]
QKVALVEAVWETHGLAPALAAVEFPKSTWYYHCNQKVAYEEKYAHLRPDLEAIARQHPEYGHRRTTVELREIYGHVVNHKVVQRLHQLWGLPLLRSTRAPKPSGIRQAIIAAGGRVNLVAQLEQIGLFEVAYTDFTELLFADGTRKAYLIPIIRHVCKMFYTALALLVWKRAKEAFQQYDIPYVGMIIHHDQDVVFTGYGWTGQLLLEDGVRLSYALRGAQDNPEMEAFISRFSVQDPEIVGSGKEENRSLFLDAQTLDELRAVVGDRMVYHNNERRHSRTESLAPLRYVEMLQSSP